MVSRLTCVVINEVRFSLVSVSFLPVRRERSQTVVIRRVWVARVSVVLRDVALATAPTGVVWADPCNFVCHDTVHFVYIVVVVLGLPLLLLAVPQAAGHGHGGSSAHADSPTNCDMVQYCTVLYCTVTCCCHQAHVGLRTA